MWRDVAQGINRISDRTETALSHLGEILAALERGDLSPRMGQGYSGTFAELAEAANASLDQLEGAFHYILEGVRSVGEASAELRAGTDDLAKRSEDQAQAVYDSAAVTSYLAATVTHNAAHLTECRGMMQGLLERTSKGQGVALDAVTSIAAVEEASEQMGKIVGTIDEIAFQTNLLALNASVEAARAGDAGKGFGVVAAEVRALAARCSDASQQIGSLIDDTVAGVKQGAAHVRDTGGAMGEIQDRLREIETAISAVHDAGKQQTAGVDILNASIRRVEAAAQSNAALAQENNSLTASLAQLEARLTEALSAFDVKDRRAAAPRRRSSAQARAPDFATPGSLAQ